MLSSEFEAGRSADLHDTPARLSIPGQTNPLSTPGNALSSSPRSTGQLTGPVSAVAEPMNTLPALRSTEKLTTGHLPVVTGGAAPWTTGRMPVVIHGVSKKRPAPANPRPIKTKHRVILHASVVFIVVAFVLTTLITFLPLGENGHALGVGGLLQNLGVMHMTNANTNNTALVGAQAATATAIMQNDGYVPSAAVSQQYNASLGITSSANLFPYGQCTWWADERYHQLSGYYVPFGGNAYQWAYNATAYSGWVVSSTPHFPSIMVFAPGVQYASPVYGHVAVVEAINSDGSITTSNMNVLGHPFGAVVDMTNYPGAGVSFVYHA